MTTIDERNETHLSVPFVDLGAAAATITPSILEAIGEIADSGAFSNGPAVRSFEDAFAASCGRLHCVGVASGLDALRLALIACGLEEGDEVIVPAMTFIATFEAVVQAGGRPVVVDVREDDVGMDVDAAAALVGDRTRFVLPVHLYGQMADARALAALADRHGLDVIEDACQAHGAERDGIGSGALGRAAAFSFYPSKNLGAWGDAGALVLDDDAVAAKVRALREHGQVERYRSALVGYTSRLDTVQAVVLVHKLPLLDRWNEQRRVAAGYYNHALADVGDLRLPVEVDGARHVWHVYAARTADPGALAAFLSERGISTGRHYPEPPHLSAAFAGLGLPAGSFPVAEAVARETLSLPIYPGIREAQLDAVARAVREFFGRG
jgi:dTDP-4-amino-4,6-dideoxygalactose transaminase